MKKYQIMNLKEYRFKLFPKCKFSGCLKSLSVDLLDLALAVHLAIAVHLAATLLLMKLVRLDGKPGGRLFGSCK